MCCWSRRLSAGRPLTVALVALTAACSGGGTSILVRISAPGPLASLSANVSAGTVTGTRQWTTPQLPATLVLVLSQDLSVDVDVTMSAVDGNGAPLLQRATVRSVPHRRVTLDVALDGGSDGTPAGDASADGAGDAATGDDLVGSPVDMAGSTCTPTTCAAQGKNCDTISDGCGKNLYCGSCTLPEVCGGNGTANVCACDTSGVNVALTSLNSVSQVSGSMSGGASLSRVTAGSCPTSLNTSSMVNGVYYVVQNQTTSSATLSSWAVCPSGTNAAAFLAYYPGSTIPSSSAERQSCSGSVAEGASATGALSSPESNGNSWCGGLTKANGGGISVPACGTVVVFMQQWPGDPDPSALKFELQ